MLKTKYHIRREDYGDEDKEIIVFDVYDENAKTIVSSHDTEAQAENWINEQTAINYRLKNSPFSDSLEYHQSFA